MNKFKKIAVATALAATTLASSVGSTPAAAETVDINDGVFDLCTYSSRLSRGHYFTVECGQESVALARLGKIYIRTHDEHKDYNNIVNTIASLKKMKDRPAGSYSWYTKSISKIDLIYSSQQIGGSRPARGNGTTYEPGSWKGMTPSEQEEIRTEWRESHFSERPGILERFDSFERRGVLGEMITPPEQKFSSGSDASNYNSDGEFDPDLADPLGTEHCDNPGGSC